MNIFEKAKNLTYFYLLSVSIRVRVMRRNSFQTHLCDNLPFIEARKKKPAVTLNISLTCLLRLPGFVMAEPGRRV